MWWLAAAPLSRVSSALVAEVQTEATLMLGARVEGGGGGKRKDLRKSPGSQLFNPGQDIICYMPSVHEIWGRIHSCFAAINTPFRI